MYKEVDSRITEEKSSRINNLNFYLKNKKLDKQDQTEPQTEKEIR